MPTMAIFCLDDMAGVLESEASLVTHLTNIVIAVGITYGVMSKVIINVSIGGSTGRHGNTYEK